MASRNFLDTQKAFAAHLRNPAENPSLEDVEDRRMKIYRDLFYKNIEGMLANNFPVFRKITSDENWHAMVRDFYSRHQSDSPYFSRIPEEFIAYLQEERAPEETDFPFMLELVHYEYMEVVLDTAEEEIPDAGFNPEGDLLNGAPAVSPLVCVLGYYWPVHQVSASFIPKEPLDQPVHLVVYRNREHQVKFMEINPVTARLLALLQEDDMLTGQAAMECIHSELGGSHDWEALKANGLDILRQLKGLDIILGTRIEAVS